jgi:hypothetical protein
MLARTHAKVHIGARHRLTKGTIMDRLGIVVLVVLVACGRGDGQQSPGAIDAPERPDGPVDEGPPDGLTLSGSRIKVSWLSTSDGFKFHPASYDSLLQSPCNWMSFSDGAYCIPDMAFGANYLDSGCTRPVLMFSPPMCQSSPPAYYGALMETTCGSQVLTINAVGQRIAVSQVFSGSPASCTATSPPSGAEFYDVDAVVPLSTFVKATPSIETGSGRIAHTYLAAEDGARIVTDIRDTVLDARCVLVGSIDHVRCVPYPIGPIETLFSDSDCRSRLVDKITIPCSPPFFTRSLYDPATCSAGVFALGADFTGTTVYRMDNMTCTQEPIVFGPQQYLVSEIAVPTLTYSPPSTRLGSGSVRYEGFTSPYEVALGTNLFHDRKLDIECLPSLGADGVQRCMPEPDQFPYPNVAYTDPLCTVQVNIAPLAPRLNSRTCAVGPPRFVVTSDLNPTCTTMGPSFSLHAFPVTTPTTPLYAKEASSCVPFSGPYYVIGPEEPATSFEEIRTTIEL